jgi:exodeoxyribonuclease-3
VITLEFQEYFLVNIYSPNSQRGLTRIEGRMIWENHLLNYLKKLEATKPVVFCGDLNVAHKEIDLKNPGTNKKNAGFTEEERGKFSELLDAGFVDTFRYFNPDKRDAYTWWSYMFNARENNAGWRIDYFITSEILSKKLISVEIHPDVMGSDHCPVELTIN